MRAKQNFILLFFGGYLVTFLGSAVAQEVNERLSAAQADFEREFLREVEVIQRKYLTALEGNRRTFTQSGDLTAAKEAHGEYKKARSWRTIPKIYGARSFQNELLNTLLKNYEAALENAIRQPVARHAGKLEDLKKYFATAGNFTAATTLEEELKRLHEGDAIPIEAGARLQYSRFSKSEFEEWLKDITVKFAGIFAGETFVRFGDDKLTYTSKGMPLEYGYAIKDARTVEIFNGNWQIQFAKDLHSGTFRTQDNSYDIEILYEGDPEVAEVPTSAE